MQQKARDNRAYLKSTRRDLGELPDQEEQDEEGAGIFHSANFAAPPTPAPSGIVDNRNGPHGGAMEIGRQVTGLQQPQLSPAHDSRVKMGMVGSVPDYNTFIKPKPPSRYGGVIICKRLFFNAKLKIDIVMGLSFLIPL